MGWCVLHRDLQKFLQLTAFLVYLEYARTSNLVAVAIYLGTLVAAQTAQIGELCGLALGISGTDA